MYKKVTLLLIKRKLPQNKQTSKRLSFQGKIMKNKNVKFIMYSFVILSSLFLISCSDDKVLFDIGTVDNTNFSASETFSQNVAVNNQVKFILNGINGLIIVRITDDPLVMISGIRIVESQSLEDAQAYLKNLQVSIKDRGSDVFVQTQQPEKNHGRNLIVNYDISIPKSWMINIENINGDIKIDSMEGNILVNLVNGTVSLNDIFADVIVDVVNGTIDGQVALPDQGSCTMALVNGAINLSIPQSTSAQFSAKLTNGSISITDLVLQNIQSSNTAVTGTLSTGLGSIDLETVNGGINVNGF